MKRRVRVGWVVLGKHDNIYYRLFMSRAEAIGGITRGLEGTEISNTEAVKRWRSTARRHSLRCWPVYAMPLRQVQHD